MVGGGENVSRDSNMNLCYEVATLSYQQDHLLTLSNFIDVLKAYAVDYQDYSRRAVPGRAQ